MMCQIPNLPSSGLLAKQIKNNHQLKDSVGKGFVNHSEKEWEFRGYIICDDYDSEDNMFQLRASEFQLRASKEPDKQ